MSKIILQIMSKLKLWKGTQWLGRATHSPLIKLCQRLNAFLCYMRVIWVLAYKRAGLSIVTGIHLCLHLTYSSKSLNLILFLLSSVFLITTSGTNSFLKNLSLRFTWCPCTLSQIVSFKNRLGIKLSR